ncbi:MAG: hypothetical protein Q4G68_05700 [Planctomycetia bacterium]|nr:hypothetical protein [Planctomycetia bacterium]
MDTFCNTVRPIDDVEELIRNAELRTELEPYYDEAISRVNVQSWPLESVNDFLASMLDWERAPELPIRDWFNPPLNLPPASLLSESQVSEILADVVNRLFDKGIILDYADHLSDRELYQMIVKDILPIREKKIDNPSLYHHWDCCNRSDIDNEELWLMYYASEEDRDLWQETHEGQLPPKLTPPCRRHLPGCAMD